LPELKEHLVQIHGLRLFKTGQAIQSLKIAHAIHAAIAAHLCKKQTNNAAEAHYFIHFHELTAQ
jgi:hypothetical protein